MQYVEIENWTSSFRNECKLPEDQERDHCEFIAEKVMYGFQLLAEFRESLKNSKERYALLERLRIDENIFDSEYFSKMGFPHVLEHSALDFQTDEEWLAMEKQLPTKQYDFLASCLREATLDIYQAEIDEEGFMQARSLLHGNQTPIHGTYFPKPLRDGDFFVGRLYRTSVLNFLTFPFMVYEERAKEWATLLQNTFAQLRQQNEKLTWDAFIRGRGAEQLITLMVDDMSALIKTDPELPNVSLNKLNELQLAFLLLSQEADDYPKGTLENFTKNGEMFAFINQEIPELHLYFDPNTREFLQEGGMVYHTKGFLSVYFLPREYAEYARFIGNPKWCVGITKKGPGLRAEDVTDADMDQLLELIKTVRLMLKTADKYAA